MVALSNPRTESQLISLASTIADANDGLVDIAHIVQVPDRTPFYTDSDRSNRVTVESEQLLDVAHERAETFGSTVETTTIVSQWSLEEVFDMARQRNANMVVMGWGTRSQSWQAGRTEGSINELARNLPCDFFVLKGRKVDVDRILVPIAADTPNANLSAEIAKQLRARVDSEISLLHVVDGEEKRAEGREFLAEWARDHDLGAAELLIDTSGDVKSAIRQAAEDRTLVIIGATERGLLSRLLRDSLASDVVDTVDCSVLLAERPTTRPVRERIFGLRER